MMNQNLFRQLRKWRDATAKKEMTDTFRVLPNKTIEDVVRMEPKTKEELTSIKGIKDKKYYKYGQEILKIVKENKVDNGLNNRPASFRDYIFSSKNNVLGSRPLNFQDLATVEVNKKEKVYAIGEFLDYLNGKLMPIEVKLTGEVTSVEKREKVVYFSLKDKEDNSVLNCLIFKYQFEISGVNFEIGNEIIVSGFSEIYKPYGKLSFKARLIEIAGEGELKKNYDELKNKFEEEGLFSAERKIALPKLPERIGLITSSQGAAIGDFTTNLGNYGFKINFINSSVEGKQAVFELIKAIKRFKKMKGIDVLVIIRGGGSLESLQAFNNEALVREVASLNIPVVCGIGHEKDVSLVSLACSLAVSTPTAAARAISEPWEKVVEKLNKNELKLMSLFENYLFKSNHKIEKLSFGLSSKFEIILQRFFDVENNFLRIVENINYNIKSSRQKIDDYSRQIFLKYNQNIKSSKSKIDFLENIIKINNPKRQLKLGYSLVFLEGKIVKNIKQLKKDSSLDVKIFKGIFKARVENIKK